MKCPTCKTEMEKGYLQLGNRMLWAKRKHKVSLHPDKDEVMLVNNVMRGACFDAYICKQCRKITFDYTNIDLPEES